MRAEQHSKGGAHESWFHVGRGLIMCVTDNIWSRTGLRLNHRADRDVKRSQSGLSLNIHAFMLNLLRLKSSGIYYINVGQDLILFTSHCCCCGGAGCHGWPAVRPSDRYIFIYFCTGYLFISVPLLPLSFILNALFPSSFLTWQEGFPIIEQGPAEGVFPKGSFFLATGGLCNVLELKLMHQHASS